jgi:hypothetical protein
MIDVVELVGTRFSGLSALVVGDVENAGDAIVVRAKTGGDGLPGVRERDCPRARVSRADGG